MPRGGVVGLRARQEADVPILDADPYADVETRPRAGQPDVGAAAARFERGPRARSTFPKPRTRHVPSRSSDVAYALHATMHARRRLST